MITTFEEKGEPKRIRTEVPLLTSLTPYRWAKPAHTDTGLAGRSEDQEGGAGKWGDSRTRALGSK